MSRYPSAHSHSVPAAIVAVCMALGAAAAPTQDTPVTPAWERDLDAALDASRQQQKPLLICFNADLDGESGNHAMAYGAYRDPKLLSALDDAIAVVASIDRHSAAGEICGRFEGIHCEHHQAIEKRARRLLFGDLREVVAPQHVLLFPDGSVAWHGMYQVAASTLCRKIHQARTTWQKNSRGRSSDQLARFVELLPGAATDSERYLLLRTTLCRAAEDEFAKMFRRVKDAELAERLLRDLALSWPTKAEARIASLDGCCHPTLEPVRAELLERLGTNHVQAFRADSAASDGAAPADETALGIAKPIDRVHFTDGVERELTGTTGKITVLLFFVHRDTSLATHAERWNRFVERVSGRPVEVYALGASIVPEAELTKTREVGFDFPAANYLYEESIAPYGITSFPAAVIIDGDGRVVFNGDAYNEYEKTVNRLAGSAPVARR